MPIVPATATRRHFRSCAVCALVGLVAAAAVGSLFISVEPVGSIPRTTALSAAPYARWLHVSPLKASSEHGDAEAPAEGCRTPVRVRKVSLPALNSLCSSAVPGPLCRHVVQCRRQRLVHRQQVQAK